jgi:flavin-dependent dehydrogenase
MTQALTDNGHYNICILGGGPAGLSAAIACANSIEGNIVVVEQQSLGQQRVGENIPPETLLLLRKLGLDKQFHQSGHQPCPGFASVWGKSDVGYNDFIVNPMGHSWRLNRQTFDQCLVDKAQALGVGIAWRTRFIDAKNNAKDGISISLSNKADDTSLNITADFVIDATGTSALFAKTQAIKKNVHDKLIALVSFARVNNDARGKQVRIEATPDGWCYQALLPENRIVNMMMTEQHKLSSFKTDNYAPFENYLANTKLISQHLQKLQLTQNEYHTYPIVSGILEQLEGENWIAIGDAAASFDPIAAQGIYKSLQHGLMAAEKVASWFYKKPLTLDYTQVVTHQYGHYLKNRNHMYSLEKRWQQHAFWQNRLLAAFK